MVSSSWLLRSVFVFFLFFTPFILPQPSDSLSPLYFIVISYVAFYLHVLSQFVLLLRIKAGSSRFIQAAYLRISSNTSSWVAQQPLSSQLSHPQDWK